MRSFTRCPENPRWGLPNSDLGGQGKLPREKAMLAEAGHSGCGTEGRGKGAIFLAGETAHEKGLRDGIACSWKPEKFLMVVP